MTTGSARGDIPKTTTAAGPPAAQAPPGAVARPGSSGFSDVDLAAEAGMGGGSYVPPAAPVDAAPTRRSLLGQALYDTFGRTGARVGALWIAIVAVLGVFAPFIANSHPIAMRSADGTLSFPILRSLGPVDVSIVVFFAYAVWVILRRSMTATERVVALLWPVLVTTGVVLAVKYAPSLVMFGIYRPASWGGGAGVAGWTWVVLVNLAALLLTAAAVGALVVFSVNFFRATARRPAVIAGAVVTALAMTAVSFTVRPPVNVIYEHYREVEKAGQAKWMVRTIIPYSPNDRLRDRPNEILQPPSKVHWLGTTEFGEDMLSRMLHACRVTLAIGLIATGISTAIGIVVGGLLGYYGGWVDLIGMRLVEIVEAIPRLILLLIVMVSFGRSLYLMMVVIGLVVWTSDARFIRAEFLKLRNLDFVQAAVAAGLGRMSIVFRHMLPNGVSPVLVNASFGVAWAILYESTLSFLGLGLGPDDPSWGQLLEQARKGGTGFNWWIATFPGLAIFLTVFAYILIGESMRDAIDPKLQKRD
jgi:peptide/nickel transport system permease protein